MYNGGAWEGTLEEFRKLVNEGYRKNPYDWHDYLAVVAMCEVLMKKDDDKNGNGQVLGDE